MTGQVDQHLPVIVGSRSMEFLHKHFLNDGSMYALRSGLRDGIMSFIS